MKTSRIPLIFIALIVTFMALDIGFVILAKKTYTGVYTDNHYKKGLNFNKIYGSEIYGNNGWTAKVRIDGLTVMDNARIKLENDVEHEISAQFLDANNNPIIKAIVKGKLLRPTTDKFDMLVDFEEQDGTYVTKTKIPFLGQWHLRIKANIGEEEFVTTYRLLNS